jgi:protein disulfide-isomerase
VSINERYSILTFLDVGAADVEAFDMYRHLTCVGLLLLLAGCHKPQPLRATHATHANEPPDIAWFDGSLEGAFIVAKRENRPVLIYWGAEWCPFCHTLKSTVFSRPDFIAQSRLFLPVYLDGDDDGAQKWGESFHIEGYPTLIVLDPERNEIMRLGAGRDVAQYAAVLDLALESIAPVGVLLQSAVDGKALSMRECSRLAYNSWELDPLEPSGYQERATALMAAATQCPRNAELERADLTVYAAYYAADAQSEALDQPKAQASPLLSGLEDQVALILSQPELAASAAGALGMLDDSFFKAVALRGAAFASPILEHYVAAMNTAANDQRFALADQLGFIDSKLRALKDLGKPKAPLPKSELAAAHERIDAALSTEQNPYVRSGLVDAALTILEDIGDYPDAYQIAQAEIGRASAPYYYKADLAAIAEKMGHKDEALALLDQAYHESQGAATRFQWGSLYVSGLLRMTPKDTQRIADAGAAVLSELDGQDRIYLRARVRLERLDQELRAWNQGAKGAYDNVLQSLHAHMQQICVKIPDKDPARPDRRRRAMR